MKNYRFCESDKLEWSLFRPAPYLQEMRLKTISKNNEVIPLSIACPENDIIIKDLKRQEVFYNSEGYIKICDDFKKENKDKIHKTYILEYSEEDIRDRVYLFFSLECFEKNMTRILHQSTYNRVSDLCIDISYSRSMYKQCSINDIIIFFPEHIILEVLSYLKTFDIEYSIDSEIKLLCGISIKLDPNLKNDEFNVITSRP